MESSYQERKPFFLRNYCRENLGKVFEHYLVNVMGYKNDSPVTILSVGCGHDSYEAEPLLRVFPNATYTGIDIDSVAIGESKERNRDLNSRCRFQTADAYEKEAFGSKPWDIIVLLNPQVGSGTKGDWYRIMENSVDALGEDGTIFISVSQDHELDMVLRYVDCYRDRIQLVVNEPNRYPSEKAVFTNSFVIIAKKIGERNQ